MAVMDEFKEERESLKNGTPKQKFQYFWYYYKWHVIVGIGVIAFAVSMIVNLINQKETAFFAALLNATELQNAPEYNQGFLEYVGIDTEEYDTFFDSSLYLSTTAMDENTMATQQKMMVYIAAAEIDIMGARSDVFSSYAYNDTFYDLRDLLSAEQLERYEPYFYYIDRVVLEEKEAAMEDLSTEYVLEAPDPTKPELMEDPIPVAVLIDDCQALNESYYFSGEGPAALGIVVNSQHAELAAQYLDYIFQ